MKENKTTYAYLIEHMQAPSFQKVWDIAYDFVLKLPSDLCNELHESLNRGIDILDSEPLLQMYIYAFGKMHNAKLQYAFQHLHKNALSYKEIEIVDYGCGQGLASICYHDFISGSGINQTVKRITLIEPSTIALSRAELLCSAFFPSAEIIAINKRFDELDGEDYIVSSQIPTIHLFSNILDIESYDLSRLAQIVKEQSKGDNEYVLVSPMQNEQRLQRLKTFASSIEKHVYFEQYLEKRQLDSEKDWTCSVLLCSQQNVIEYNCDEVFKEATLFTDKRNYDSNVEQGKEILHKLRVCAEYGDNKCQNELAVWYYYGIIVNQDYRLAFEWCEKSAKQGDGLALANLGILYMTGKGVEQNIPKAVEIFTKGAETNHATCLFFLGNCYKNGDGVEKNLEKAFLLYNRSSEHGGVFAKNALFACYYYGLGTEKNERLALKMLKEAVKLNHPKSCYQMAQLYTNGELLGKNEHKAFRLFKKSAALGYLKAQTKMGDIYRTGALGKEENPKKSYKWYLKAASQDDASAQFYVGYYYASGYGVNKDDNLAFEWYCKAAEQNNREALNNLAVCYKYGRGTTVDLTKAVYYYEKAAKLGNVTAQKNLAICYRNGTGVEIDLQKVFYWTLEAAKNGNRDSLLKVALYCFKGYGTDKNNAQALLWYARYFFDSNIGNIEEAYHSFQEKAKEGNSQALYIIGKCLQYGILTNKNFKEANSYFEKAAELGHIESLIKTGRISSLYELCSCKEETNSYKDSYGVKYSPDKKILIDGGYLQKKEYHIPLGTRIICDNAFHWGNIEKIKIPSSVIAIGKNPFTEIRSGRFKVKIIECHSPNFIVSGNALYTRDMKKIISYFGDASEFVIQEGVEIIGSQAFAENEELQDIRFPESLCYIENQSFQYCSHLKRIALPKSVSRIGKECFYGCESLTEILSLGSVSIIPEESFMGCNIQQLCLPESLLEIGDNAFNSNHNLKFIALPENVERIGDSCFAYCSITEISLNNKLVEIGDNAFNSNDNLKFIVIPENVKRIGDSCFAYCPITEISLNNKLVEIGDFCFSHCPIDKIEIPSSVRRIGKNPFIGTKLIECKENPEFVSENGMLYDRSHKGLISYFGDSEVAIYPPICRVNSYAFYNLEVTTVFMGSNIIEIAPWAFYNAAKLENVIWRKCQIKEIPEGCFGNCSGLHKIDIPSSVLKIQKGSFFDCRDLKIMRFYGIETIADQKMFMRITGQHSIPYRYRSPYVRGSSICESHKRTININTFPIIEIIVPKGCCEKYSFSAIYDEYENFWGYGIDYGMDRQFIIRDDEKE